MNKFKDAVLKELQELQKIGVCRNYDIVETVSKLDLTEYEDMSISEAANLMMDLYA